MDFTFKDILKKSLSISPVLNNSSKLHMTRGAIAIIDALGFKGIWTRENPEAVLRVLKSLRRRGINLQGDDHSGSLVSDSGFRHRVRCMSDTIVITVMVKGKRQPDRCTYKAMYSAIWIAGDIIMEGLRSNPPLLFRGCVATGEMSESADFLIGPAVDEAAESSEKADGPFLWLAKSASEIESRFADTFYDRLDPALMVPVRVPMRDGCRIDTHAFNYFCVTNAEAFRSEIRSRILLAFGSVPLAEAVQRKKTNTVKYLRHIDQLAKAGMWKQRRPARMPHWTDLTTDQRLALLAQGVRPENMP